MLICFCYIKQSIFYCISCFIHVHGSEQQRKTARTIMLKLYISIFPVNFDLKNHKPVKSITISYKHIGSSNGLQWILCQFMFNILMFASDFQLFYAYNVPVIAGQMVLLSSSVTLQVLELWPLNIYSFHFTYKYKMCTGIFFFIEKSAFQPNL